MIAPAVDVFELAIIDRAQRWHDMETVKGYAASFVRYAVACSKCCGRSPYIRAAAPFCGFCERCKAS